MSEDRRRDPAKDADLPRRAADEVVRQILTGRPEPVRLRPVSPRERKSFRGD